MTCSEIQPYLDDYLADRLGDDFRADLEEHLKNCNRCREELEQLKILTGVLTIEKVPDPGEKYWDSVETHILSRTVDKPNPTVEKTSLRPVISIMKYAVSLAAVFLIFAITIVMSVPESETILGTETEEYQTVAAITQLAELSIAGDMAGSNLLSSIILSSPGSFGQQEIILGRLSNDAIGKDNNDTRIN